MNLNQWKWYLINTWEIVWSLMTQQLFFKCLHLVQTNQKSIILRTTNWSCINNFNDNMDKGLWVFFKNFFKRSFSFTYGPQYFFINCFDKTSILLHFCFFILIILTIVCTRRYRYIVISFNYNFKRQYLQTIQYNK